MLNFSGNQVKDELYLKALILQQSTSLVKNVIYKKHVKMRRPKIERSVIRRHRKVNDKGKVI